MGAVSLGWLFSEDNFRAEIIPLLLFGMTAAIAYEKELALLLAAAIALILSFALDQGLAQFVILVSSVAARLLADWEHASTQFCKVMPKDYARVLAVIRDAEERGLSEDERDHAIMESARG